MSQGKSEAIRCGKVTQLCDKLAKFTHYGGSSEIKKRALSII